MLKPVEINSVLKSCRDWFVDFEVYIGTGLSEHLKAAFPIKPEDAIVIVDLDEDNVVHSVANDALVLRYNGRFFIPDTDKNDTKLAYKSEDWEESVKGWFLKETIQVTTLIKAGILRFTALVPSITLPAGAGAPEEAPKATEDTKEPTEDATETPDEPDEAKKTAPEELPDEEAREEEAEDDEELTEEDMVL